MDFAALPPEINSSRIYSGPGTGPILAAAAAWDQLANDMNSSAAAYRSVVAGLTTDGWQGPSAMMVSNAVAPYVAWMHSTAAQAEQTAVQAKTAAAAYQTAFTMTVPPVLVAANRTQLMSLIVGNFFGQNSPAIAATEADYDRMWAQDAGAMYSYNASATAASTLPPFTNPPPTTSQAAAAAPSAPTPVAPATPFTLTDVFNDTVSSTSGAASVSSSSFGSASIATTNHAIGINALRDEHQGIGPFLVGSAGSSAPAVPVTVGRPAVSALMGRASIAGTLSVPQSWSATASTPLKAAAMALPSLSAVTAPAVGGTLPPGMFGEAMLGTLAGRGVSNAAAKRRRPTVIPRSPAAG
ncbi:MAG: PPE family protein [Mycobacterium sp.]